MTGGRVNRSWRDWLHGQPKKYEAIYKLREESKCINNLLVSKPAKNKSSQVSRVSGRRQYRTDIRTHNSILTYRIHTLISNQPTNQPINQSINQSLHLCSSYYYCIVTSRLGWYHTYKHTLRVNEEQCLKLMI